MILVAFGFWRLRIDTDILNLLPSHGRVAEGLKLYQERFLESGELLVTLRAGSAEEADRAVAVLSSELNLSTNLVRRVFAKSPATESIDHAARFLAYLWLNTDPSKVAELRGNLMQNRATVLGNARARVQSSLSPADIMLLPRDPFRLSAVIPEDEGTFNAPERFFSSSDGKFRIIYLYSNWDLSGYQACREWLRQIRETLTRTAQKHSLAVEFGLTGRPVFVDEIASGMRSDMSTAAPGTLLMIALLFFAAHREWGALIILVSSLALTLLCTVAVGAAILGNLNVISIGFAAILLGLAEDFGIVLHQETKSHPSYSLSQVRAVAGPGIFWSAITTASAFGLLNLSSLPGLRQFGTLVALGILIGAWIMMNLLLPSLFHWRGLPVPTRSPSRSRNTSRSSPAPVIPLALSAILLLASTVVLILFPPTFSSSPDVLRPRRSEASETLRRVQANIGADVEPYWLFFRGSSVTEVRQKLEEMNSYLSTNRSALSIESFTLPMTVWPNENNQAINKPVLSEIAKDPSSIRQELLQAGFTEEAFELTSVILREWSTYTNTDVQWPSGRVAEWILPKFVSRAETDFLALGLLTPARGFRAEAVVPPELGDSVVLSGWNLMGQTVVRQVKRETPLICLAVGALIIVALWITFRRLSGVLFSVLVLTFGGVVLASLMSVLRWEWNLINLAALPLLLGMGIDYSIHIQLAMDRSHGAWGEPARAISRALALAGSTSIIGFAFLATSSNAGMANLGGVCALGLTIFLLISIFLLPAWITFFTRRFCRE